MQEPLYKDYLRKPVVLIGCGGIGSNLWPVLAKLGVEDWTLYDDDVVAPVNLALQNFSESDVGLRKCDVLAGNIARMNSRARVTVCPRRFVSTDSLDGIVIAAVDSMETGRHVIFDVVCRQRERVSLYIDGRLSRKFNEFFDLFAIDPNDQWEVDAYRELLFKDAESIQAPRPEKPSIHTPVLLAGYIGAIFARWAQRERRPWRVTFDAVAWHAEPYYAPAQQKKE